MTEGVVPYNLYAYNGPGPLMGLTNLMGRRNRLCFVEIKLAKQALFRRDRVMANHLIRRVVQSHKQFRFFNEFDHATIIIHIILLQHVKSQVNKSNN